MTCDILSVETMAEEVTEDDEWDMFLPSKLSIERKGREGKIEESE